MKTLFIEARSNADIRLSPAQLSQLPKKIGIASTVQHFHKIRDVQEQIPGSIVAGQVLGCNASCAAKIKDKVDAFLCIGSGAFHPLRIASETGKEVFCFSPFTKKMSRITGAEIEKEQKRKKSALLKFLSADRVGILVCTKPGQSRMKEALEIAKKKDKKYFIFAFDTLDERELENFPFIQSWINTACPRIAEKGISLINLEDLPD